MRAKLRTKTKRVEHCIPSSLLEKRVRVSVVGCGGTGSAVAAGLPYLHQAMVAWGHPHGLHVTLVDGDKISRTNCIRQPFSETRVIETYPVLAMIALDWMLPDSRVGGRLPKYNPKRKKTFSISDWQHVCNRVSTALAERGLADIVRWVNDVGQHPSPRKSDQDGVDACLCLLAAVYLVERKDCLMVGNWETGYVVAPHGENLRAELDVRCEQTGLVPAEWVRVFKMAVPFKRTRNSGVM